MSGDLHVRIVTASAGTGKTTRLAELLRDALLDGSARPEAVIATTFTRQAATELQTRARTRLLQERRAQEAQALLAARIGTVNAVCGGLVSDYALELGLSPEMRVLDEPAAEAALGRALASSTSDAESERLQSYRSRFDQHFDWHYEVRRLIESARANQVSPEVMVECAERSVQSLDSCLGEVAADGESLDITLAAAIEHAMGGIDAGDDVTKGTATYRALLERGQRNLQRKRRVWRDWASLTTQVPTKKSLALAGPVQEAAARHIAHPALRREMHELIELIFRVAARGLGTYQDMKRQQGMIDFVDQEVFALDLLSRDELASLVAEQLDLVLVDEFQDTSPLQLAIFLKLAALANQSVWVGDPKQAIFGFRGTDPTLMDAAIETLSDPTRDPELVQAAVRSLAPEGQAPPATEGTTSHLERTFRSRPALVELTNALFVPAFGTHQGMAADRVRVTADRPESDGLGPALQQWSLLDATNGAKRAAAVAAGVRQLLADEPLVWDRSSDQHRPARAGDIGVLCRTNAQCREVAEQLGRFDIHSVVARVGLYSTAEAQVLLAGLRLWVDPRDRLAAATLARIAEYPDDASGFLGHALTPRGPQEEASSHSPFFSSPAVSAIVRAREHEPDLGILGAIDAVVAAVELPHLAAAWGESAQRTANLDALRAHAARYAKERHVGGDAATLVGFIAHFDELATDDWWGRPTRGDTIARMGGQDAVTVSTWHAAKGLEWPIVLMFGLESLRKPEAHGVHVLSDRPAFDVTDPLGGRYLHFWPSPYTNAAQKGPVKDAYAQSVEYQHIAAKAEREALRVLYVGWTRARDTLVLAAKQGSLLNGLLGTLSAIEAGLISESLVDGDDTVDVEWGGHQFQLPVTLLGPVTSAASPARLGGQIRTGAAPGEIAPARLSPSNPVPRPGVLGEPVRIGEAIRPRGQFVETVMGDAVHAFFAADATGRVEARASRVELAAALLQRHGIGAALPAAELVEMADRLWRWLESSTGSEAEIAVEVPIAHRLEGGTQVLGECDLLVRSGGRAVVVDHKIYGLATATELVGGLAGQLGLYADVVAAAESVADVDTWVHLPFAGLVVELTTPQPSGSAQPPQDAQPPGDDGIYVPGELVE